MKRVHFVLKTEVSDQVEVHIQMSRRKPLTRPFHGATDAPLGGNKGVLAGLGC